MRLLRDQASKQVDQELGIVRGNRGRQQLTACKESRGDKDERVEGGYIEPMQEPGANTSTGDEHELERGRDQVDTLREFIVWSGALELALG